jgi:molybdenum cofactor cytidylyltransferase
LCSELIALDGDQGARMLLEKHRDSLKLIECADAGVLYDIDRRTDVAP